MTDRVLAGDGAARHRPEAPTMVESTLTWAEDTATLGSDPSADPGAKTEGRAIESVALPVNSGYHSHGCSGLASKR